MIETNISRCESCGKWSYFPEYHRLAGLPLVCVYCLRKSEGK